MQSCDVLIHFKFVKSYNIKSLNVYILSMRWFLPFFVA